jgi:hypothetical protein
MASPAENLLEKNLNAAKEVVGNSDSAFKVGYG